jgi:hypothetical protein
MTEIPEGASFRATYGERHSLAVTQRKGSVSISVVDREKGNVAGRWTAEADTIEAAKEIAVAEAKRQLGALAPNTSPDWEYFDAPPPVLF